LSRLSPIFLRSPGFRSLFLLELTDTLYNKIAILIHQESIVKHRQYSCFDNHVDAKYIRWAWPLQKKQRNLERWRTRVTAAALQLPLYH